MDRAGADPQAALGKNLVSAADRHRHDGNTRLHGKNEAALLEGEEVTVGAASAFHEHHDGGTAPDRAQRSIEPADGLVAVGSFDEYEAGEPQRPAEDRNVEQPPFGHHSEIGVHGEHEGGDVELTL